MPDALIYESIPSTVNNATLLWMGVVMAGMMFAAGMYTGVPTLGIQIKKKWSCLYAWLVYLLIAPMLSLAFILISMLPTSVSAGLVLAVATPVSAAACSASILGRANTHLVSVIALITVSVCCLMTPALFYLWGSANPITAPFAKSLKLTDGYPFSQAVFVYALPYILGVTINKLQSPSKHFVEMFNAGCFGAYLLIVLMIAYGNQEAVASGLVPMILLTTVFMGSITWVSFQLSLLAGLKREDARAISLLSISGLTTIGFKAAVEGMSGEYGMAHTLGIWTVAQAGWMGLLLLWWRRKDLYWSRATQ